MSNASIRILVIEDNEADSELIRVMMEEDAPGVFEFKPAYTLAQGMQELSANSFDAVLLDLGLPDSKGLNTLNKLLAAFPAMPFIVLTGLADESAAIEAVKRGAQDYITKDQLSWKSLRASIRYAIKRKELEIALRENINLQKRIVKGTVEGLVRLTGLRDNPCSEHLRRTAHLAASIAEEMGYPQDSVEFVKTAALLHDIGNAAVPADILNKPGKLIGLELELERSHVKAGYQVIEDIEFPWPVAEVIMQHHERMDGSGYPRQLSGDSILPEARILMVADVMDAMSTYRPWRPETPGITAAIMEIRAGSGKLYDSAVVDICLKLFKEKRFQLE